MFTTVRAKLFALLGGLILGLVADNAEVFKSFAHLSDLSALAKGQAEVSEQILLLRRNEKDFLARHDDKYFGDFQKNLKTLEENVASLRHTAQKVDLPTVDANLAAVWGNVQSYAQLFDDVHNAETQLGLTEEKGLQGDLRTAVHQAEAVFNQLQADRLDKDMLMLRRNEKEIMLRGNTK